MSRDRLGTDDELAGALGPLAHPPPLTPSAPPPLKPADKSADKGKATPAGLFEPVRVQGEDEIGRAATDDKVAILRRKVIALENRIQQIRDSWSARDAELEAAVQASQREKRAREDAEATIAKLNAFVAQKKNEIETYHERVQEALREQAKRESEAARAHAEREKELIQSANRREQELQDRATRREQDAHQAALSRQQEAQQSGARLLKEASDGHVRRERELTEQLTRREREMGEALARREKELLDDHARRERTALQEHTRREQELLLRAETAERELRNAAERVSATPPPPPPPIDLAELEEITKSLTTAGRNVATIIKGQMPNDLVQEALRDALKQIKWCLDQVASLTRDLG